MKGVLSFVTGITFLCAIQINVQAANYYGRQLCNYSQFNCVKPATKSWERLFPNPRERDMVMRLNRTNRPIGSRPWIIVPKNLQSVSLMSLSPFAAKISPPGGNAVLVSIDKQAFGAYDGSGRLVRWGPISSAKGYCADIHGRCTTPTGSFHVTGKKGAECISTKFPVTTRGGAPMPYCMFFHGGYALHGSYELPGYNASHGCVRMYKADAEWLNQSFLRIGSKVIVSRS